MRDENYVYTTDWGFNNGMHVLNWAGEANKSYILWRTAVNIVSGDEPDTTVWAYTARGVDPERWPVLDP